MTTKTVETGCGCCGSPGDQLCYMEATAKQVSESRISVRVVAKRGSNQGYEEIHHQQDMEGRGASIEEAIEVVADDVIELEGFDSITAPERRQMLRDLEYEWEDAETDDSAPQSHMESPSRHDR